MRYILVGGGGGALDVEAIIYDLSKATGEDHSVSGICSFDTPRFEDFLTPRERLFHVRDVTDHVPDSDEAFLIAIGDATKRLRIAQQLADAKLPVATLIHPTAVVAPQAVIGAGSIIYAFACIGPTAKVGEHALINTYASMGHDTEIGAGTVLGPYANLNANSSVGDAVFLATGSIVLSKVILGSYSKLAAGGVLKSSAPPGSLLHGNPAVGRVMFEVPKPKPHA